MLVKPSAFSPLPAPNVTKLHGNALSYHEIQLSWDEPEPANGILKPYEVFCLGNEEQSTAPIKTVNRVVNVSNLNSDEEYKCILKASTYPDEQQDPRECEVSVESEYIKTFDTG